jgi:hypothetical protein
MEEKVVFLHAEASDDGFIITGNGNPVQQFGLLTLLIVNLVSAHIQSHPGTVVNGDSVQEVLSKMRVIKKGEGDGPAN